MTISCNHKRREALENNSPQPLKVHDKDARGKCMTDCDRDLAAAVRFGYNSGTSFGKAFAIYVWMRFNTFPDPGENDPNCPKCKNKSKWG